MGDPKKLRKKYSTPNHPWNKSVIEAERILVREYGLAKKQEIYVANSFIKKYRSIAKSLIVNQSAQGLKEKDQMMNKLRRLGLLSVDSSLDDVLSLEPRDLLERRLQTLVFKKGFGRSIKQARQFITHRHVLIGDKEISSPSYFVSTEEETLINFKENSSLFSLDHPERVDPNKDIKEEVESIKNSPVNEGDEKESSEVVETAVEKSTEKVSATKTKKDNKNLVAEEKSEEKSEEKESQSNEEEKKE